MDLRTFAARFFNSPAGKSLSDANCAIIPDNCFVSADEKSSSVFIIRVFISHAALLVNVTASIFLNMSLRGDDNTIFRYSFTSVYVFPEPAEALYTLNFPISSAFYLY